MKTVPTITARITSGMYESGFTSAYRPRPTALTQKNPLTSTTRNVRVM
jgi:hypothetical protein